MVQTVQKKKQSITLTAVDFEILDLIHTYHFLTRGQLTRLRYSAGSETTAQDRLKRLADSGFLLRRKLPHVGTGNTEYLYYLSHIGQKELQAIGVVNFSRVRKDDVEEMKLPHLEHLLAVNDFLIAARLLSRSVPEMTLVEMRHDLDLKKTGAIKVSYDCRIAGGDRTKEQVTIIPDAWMDFRYIPVNGGKEKRRVLVVELDRGSIDQNRLKQKFRAYCEYAISEAYQELFGTDLIMVVYVTPAGEYRRKQLVAWCEEELQLQNLEEENNLFRFGVLPPSLDRREIFLTPHFSKPFDNTPVPLLWSV